MCNVDAKQKEKEPKKRKGREKEREIVLHDSPPLWVFASYLYVFVCVRVWVLPYDVCF